MSERAVISGEGVALDLPRAGIGSRVVASLIDLAAQAIAFWLVTIVDAATSASSDEAATAALLLTEFVLIFGGYPIVCEWLSRGRTLGKLCLGLRVVRDDGGPIGFRHALVRGLSSLILEKPGITGGLTAAAGLITAVFSEQDKRIGDMLAGTFVLNERAGTSRHAVFYDWGIPPALQPWAASLDLTRLDDRLALSVRQYLTRAHLMSYDAQQAIAQQLAGAVCAVVAPPPPPGLPAPVLLRVVLEERRRRVPAAPPGWGAPGAAWGSPGPWSAGPPAPGPTRPPRPDDPGPRTPFTPPS